MTSCLQERLAMAQLLVCWPCNSMVGCSLFCSPCLLDETVDQCPVSMI